MAYIGRYGWNTLRTDGAIPAEELLEARRRLVPGRGRPAAAHGAAAGLRSQRSALYRRLAGGYEPGSHPAEEGTCTVTAVPTILLNNGVEIPQLGFGVFKVPPEQTEAATRTALEVGYRHVDTAQMYGNEAGVGRAVRAAGLARDEVFVTSKLDNPIHARDDALRSFDGTLAELGFDHVDLFLIHWPLPEVGDYVETWHAMEEIYRSGRARAIGVSNFQPHHLRRLLAGRRGGPGGEPGRGAPVPRAGRRPGLRRGARDRHRGLGPDRARPGAGRPGDRHDRQAAGTDAGPGHAALAHPAR